MYIVENLDSWKLWNSSLLDSGYLESLDSLNESPLRFTRLEILLDLQELRSFEICGSGDDRILHLALCLQFSKSSLLFLWTGKHLLQRMVILPCRSTNQFSVFEHSYEPQHALRWWLSLVNHAFNSRSKNIDVFVCGHLDAAPKRFSSEPGPSLDSGNRTQDIPREMWNASDTRRSITIR